jgi:hypothetical protein
VDEALKAIAEYGVALVALVSIALFAFWVVKQYLDDLRKSRDRALDISERQIQSTDKLTDTVHELVALVRDRRPT